MQARSLFFRQHPKQHLFYSLSRKNIGELYILRHAKSDHNVQNCCAGYDNRSKPTQEGLEKTHHTGKHLALMGITFDRLYVSPLERALLTAQVLLKHLPPLQIKTEHALAERNFGAFTGMSKDNIKEKLAAEAFDHYLHNPYFFPPNIGPEHKYFQSKELYGSWPTNHQGESYQCVIHRLIPFVDKVKEELRHGQTILLIGHSHNLQLLQLLLYGKAFEQGIKQYKLDHVSPVKFTFSMNTDGQLKVEERFKLYEDTTLKALNKHKQM